MSARGDAGVLARRPTCRAPAAGLAPTAGVGERPPLIQPGVENLATGLDRRAHGDLRGACSARDAFLDARRPVRARDALLDARRPVRARDALLDARPPVRARGALLDAR